MTTPLPGICSSLLLLLPIYFQLDSSFFFLLISSKKNNKQTKKHVQNVQICYIGICVPWWFVALIDLSSKISPLSPHPLILVWCSSCPCVLNVQLSLMSENMWCLIFSFCVSLLKMMASSFVHVPAKDMILFLFVAA